MYGLDFSGWTFLAVKIKTFYPERSLTKYEHLLTQIFFPRQQLKINDFDLNIMFTTSHDIIPVKDFKHIHYVPICEVRNQGFMKCQTTATLINKKKTLKCHQ